MKLNFKNKKFVICLGVLVLVVLVGGVLLWRDYNKKKSIVDLLDIYIIEDLPEGKIIKTKDKYLIFKIPDGWNLKTESQYLGHVFILSPDLFQNYKNGIEKNIFNSKKGCLIEAGVDQTTSSLEKFKTKFTKEYQAAGLESENGFETVNIKGKQALKASFVSSALGYQTFLAIVAPNRIYGFSVFSGEEDSGRCVDEFNKFLETISINK